jgi:hypothetical protein
VVGEIVTAWVMTLPMAGLVGAIAYMITAISPILLVLVAGGLLLWLRIRMAREGAPAPAH